MLKVLYKWLSSVITQLSAWIDESIWRWRVDRLREEMEWVGLAQVIIVVFAEERIIRLENLDRITRIPGYRVLMILLTKHGWQFKESFPRENSETWKLRKR